METKIHPNTERVQTALTSAGLDITVQHLPDTTHSAADAASALGVTEGQIGKSIAFDAEGKVVVVVLPGDRRVCTERLEAHLGVKIGKLPGKHVYERTGFPVGGVSPFALPDKVELVVDSALEEYGTVWVAAGTIYAVCEVEPAELIRATSARVASVSE